MANKTNWQQISSRMKQLSKWHGRLDFDSALAYMVDFHLTTFNGKSYLDNVVNVTGNAPAVFADAVRSDLLSSTWQTKVEGNISDSRKTDIEQLIKDLFEQADEYLRNEQEIASLDDWMDNHVGLRGALGIKWVSHIDKDGKLQIKCVPIDMRWCAWKRGGGLKWVAPIFFSNTDAIMADYPDVAGKLIDDSDYVLVEYWDSQTGEAWVKKGDTYSLEGSGDKIYSETNYFQKPPFVINLAPTGFMLRDKGYFEHEAEGILFKNRKLYKEQNRAMSIEQTIGMDVLYPPYERETEDMDSAPAEPVPKSGEVKKVPKGERAQPVPRGDLNRASLTAREDIYRQIEMGSPNIAELGTTDLRNVPGIWFAKQFEIRAKIETPLFRTIAFTKADLMKLAIHQILVLGTNTGFVVGKTGKKNKFTAKALGNPDDYSISFKWGISSKEMEIVNLAQAQAARGIVPDRIIIRDILQADDPAGWERELQLQKAKEANPAISLLQMAVKYAEEAADVEDEIEADMLKLQSKILLHDYVMMMRARLNPTPPEQVRQEPIEKSKANMQGLASMPKLFGGGGMVGARQPAQK